MSRYLEEAAALLRKAAEANERKYSDPRFPTSANEGRERIAQHFVTLAAIDKGLLPAEMVRDVLSAVTSRNGGA